MLVPGDGDDVSCEFKMSNEGSVFKYGYGDGNGDGDNTGRKLKMIDGGVFCTI